MLLLLFTGVVHPACADAQESCAKPIRALSLVQSARVMLEKQVAVTEDELEQVTEAESGQSMQGDSAGKQHQIEVKESDESSARKPARWQRVLDDATSCAWAGKNGDGHWAASSTQCVASCQRSGALFSHFWPTISWCSCFRKCEDKHTFSAQMQTTYGACETYVYTSHKVPKGCRRPTMWKTTSRCKHIVVLGR